ncbi:MAG: DUF1858 domain-containing protein [Lachnospiraceae bacterium]|nr:DUF1858 domain-containing protein [Lachnospiraceae bacterium]
MEAETNNNEINASTSRITKEMLLRDLLELDPDTAEILMGAGMGCIYCPASLYETIEQACLVHGIDPDDMVEELNTFLDSRA